ncbi:MAG: tRNA (adenosine(37)-N6)-threonylcarbamoyltransferase complex ATPase subunit type 1 TsaE [Proteobacteria bacterium]|nr:tRNA (adenosine(37)-N6)-threonylcarbamoyltransferase complex ATPase subunit type 1 TsaE [Pseudomonadota bacterium]
MKTDTTKHQIDTLDQLEEIAIKFYQLVLAGDVIFLQGDLGCGKTTFTQLFLKNADISGVVKSPTYALYESYANQQHNFVHMDLYRLSHPEELYYIGIEEILDDKNITLIEWPEKGQGVLPSPNWLFQFQLNHLNRKLTITKYS